MQNTKTKVSFRGTAAQHEKLLCAIERLKGGQGALMPILQEAQDIYGYLPLEVQVVIARELEVPLEEVYGIVTFYSQFNLNPKGEKQVSVCLGTACYVKGAGEIMDKLSEMLGIGNGECTEDGVFSLDSCRCIGACGLAPVIMINDDVYGRITAGEIPEILKKYKT